MIPANLISTLITTSSQVVDLIPDAVSFTPISAAGYASAYSSNVVTVTGFTAPISISVSGGTMNINGSGTAVTSGTISPGQTIKLNVTSSAVSGGVVTATLAMGGSNHPFTVTSMVVGSYLDSFKSFQTGATLSNNSLTTTTANVTTAYCSTLAVPKDGQTYYWETDLGSVGGICDVAAANAAAVSTVASLGGTPARIKMYWNTTNGFMFATATSAGAWTAFSALNTQIGGTMVQAYPAVRKSSIGSMHLRLAASEFQYEHAGCLALVAG